MCNPMREKQPTNQTVGGAAALETAAISSCACSTGSGSNASSKPTLRTCSGSPTSPHLRTWEGWLYLAAVQDAHSRQIVGWSMADHMRSELVVDAPTMAVGRRRPAPGSFTISIKAGNTCLKKELAYRQSWPTRRDLIDEIFEYIEAFHNRQRRHCTLGMRSPVEFEEGPRRSTVPDPRRHNNFNSLPTTTRTP